VRLLLALERLEDGERDLSRLALDLGYSSHSHFTAAFRRSFGTPPSAARKLLIVRL
jgi:AraC family transcriptional regulator